MSWQEHFKKGKKLVLATSLNNLPNANIVISLGLINNKLLIADCQMHTTINNLKENSNICVIGGYYKIKGKVDIFNSGKYYELCVKNNKKYPVNHALVITITEIFDLEKVKKIK